MSTGSLDPQSAQQSVPILETSNLSLPSPSSSTITDSEPASPPQPPIGFLGHIRSVLSNVGDDIVQAGGQPAPKFQADPTGGIQQVVQSATPGSLFKNLLVGSLMGLGAAARNPRGGFLGAVGSGFAGGAEYQQQQRQQARGEAIQQQELQQKKQAANMEQQKFDLDKQNFNLNMAHWNIENARQSHIADLQDQEHLESQNDFNSNAMDKALEAGGHAIAIKGADGKDLNGELGNSSAMSQWYAKNGNSSPSGGTLKWVRTTDTAAMRADGIHYDGDAGFYKDANGNRANLDKYVTNTIVDVPPNAMNSLVNVSKSEMSRFGVKTAAAQTPMTLGQYMGYAQKAQELSFEQSQQQFQKDFALLSNTNDRLAQLAEERDKIISNPSNAPVFDKGGAPAASLTADIDKESSQLSQIRDRILTRYNLAPPAPRQLGGAQQPAGNSLPVPPSGMASVQIPGQAPGQIPVAQLAAFQKKYPNAAIRMPQSAQRAEIPATSSEPTVNFVGP